MSHKTTEDKKNQFLSDLIIEIEKNKRWQIWYKFLRLVLMVTIAICGFLTATASQLTWLNSSWVLFWVGLISAVSAVLNQSISPSARFIFHQSARKALKYIKGEVKYSNMKLDEANRFMALAITNPELVLGKLEDNIKKKE